MTIRSRFGHVNLVAHDFRELARFYEQVFGCIPMPPERSLAGEWLARGTGVANAHITGVHLQLPGYGEAMPTLEILQYEQMPDRGKTVANRPGFGHIAFAVTDVQTAREAVLAAGGREVGEPATGDVPGAGRLTFVYVADPEGNIIELQCWGCRESMPALQPEDRSSGC